MSAEKAIQLITSSTPAQVGDGFFIRRPMPGAAIRLGEMSPFLLLDHAGPTHFEPSDTPRGVDEHPHRGFETVTILYSGELQHRDSFGGEGHLKAGDVQWMTAGSGLVHEEKHSQAFTERGGTLELIQLWVNLPSKDKATPPRYQDIVADHIPNVNLSKSGSYMRVIAGAYERVAGAAKTFTPMQLWDIRLLADDMIALEVQANDNTAIYVLSGNVDLADGQSVQEGEMVLFHPSGTTITLNASADSKLLLLSGTPLHEPIASYGPFVMNRAEEIQQALSDFHTGKMGTLNH